MLYPINIEIERKRKMKIVKDKLTDIKDTTKNKIKYFLFDRTNLGERIAVKMHI